MKATYHNGMSTQTCACSGEVLGHVNTWDGWMSAHSHLITIFHLDFWTGRVKYLHMVHLDLLNADLVSCTLKLTPCSFFKSKAPLKPSHRE